MVNAVKLIPIFSSIKLVVWNTWGQLKKNNPEIMSQRALKSELWLARNEILRFLIIVSYIQDGRAQLLYMHLFVENVC